MHPYFFVRNDVRRTLLALSLPLLAACSALPTPVVLDQDSFLGMSDFVDRDASARPLHVLIVHGMGTPAPYQFEEFIQGLANRFHLVQRPPDETEPEPPGCYQATPAQQALMHPRPQLISIKGVPDEDRARLYTYTFVQAPGDRAALKVSYLRWAPLTENIKCNLAAAEKGDGVPQAQIAAGLAKDFIDNKLADVALYGGTYRQRVMRPSIQGALCLMIDGKPSPDGKLCQNGHYSDPTVIITHSLGGYMLMDAIDDELRREDCGSQGNTTAHKILANTQLIYMMANQLALLDLTTLRAYPHRHEGEPASNTIAAHFSQCWHGIALKSPVFSAPTESGEAPAAKRQVVAFSDPNDILSWRIQPKDLRLPRPERGSVELTNVYLSNREFSIPLLFSDPTTAHTGYFDNRTVIDLLVCGMDKGTVKPCPAKAPP